MRPCWAHDEHQRTGKPVRRYKDFRYRTRNSWSRCRRVVGKAEHLAKGANPRFIVTSLKRKDIDARTLYERVYCARGEMENKIKECQFDLWADRTSTATMKANQLRLWFSSFAYVLIEALQRIGLAHTELANATCVILRSNSPDLVAHQSSAAPVQTRYARKQRSLAALARKPASSAPARPVATSMLEQNSTPKAPKRRGR